MRVGWILLLCLSAAVAQLPPVILYLPSSNSPGYPTRPIAAGPVATSLNLSPATRTALGPVLPINLCVALPAGCAAGCDGTFQIVPATAWNQATGVLQFNLGPFPLAQANRWTQPITEITGPRALCAGAANTPLVDNNGRPILMQAVYDCSPGNAGAANVAAAACTSPERAAVLAASTNGPQLAVLLGQTVCCTQAVNSGIPAFPQVTGVCINPNQQSCCGNQPVTLPSQCCSATTAQFPTVFDSRTPCPCGGPIPANSPAGFVAQTCPANQACCRRTKYTFDANSFGRCYDPNFFLCCDTGDVFDPAVQQCCPINGLQSANVPCPCNSHGDCQGSAFPTADGTLPDVRKSLVCCRQTAPPVNEALSCSAFDNFPSGIGTIQNQRCSGFCIDLNYQICCNGVACIREFEKCCNNTCCNTFVGTCATGFRPGALGNRWSAREYLIPYEQCSTIEVTTSINVFWIYILPTALLLATLLGFAIALAFANIAARGRLSILEKMMIFFAVFALLCACLLFFAPVYKYGILVVLVALLAIITAAARVRWLNVAFIVAVIVLLWYIIDPLDGNDYWGIGYRRLPSGKPDPWGSGMWHTTRSLWHNVTAVNDAANWCVDFYDYFRYDPALRDEQRLHNPVVTTFGYCSRGWVFALLIMEGFITLSLWLLLLLGLLALLLRFRKLAFEPVELEIVNA